MSKAKSKAPLDTLAEDRYLRELVKAKTPVAVKMDSDKVYRGIVDFFDAGIVRIARGELPNILLYKEDIKYLWEEAK